MNLCRNLLITVNVLALTMSVRAQVDPPPPPPPPQQAAPVSFNEKEASPCPQVAIQTPTPRAIREGQPVSFNARILGGDKNVTPSILWNVSGGSIRDGQGTPRVDVDSAGSGAYREIVAELWLGGYAAECSIQPPPYRLSVIPPASKLDEFGQVTLDEENEKLTAAVKAAQYGNDKIIVIGYAGRNSERMFASTALRRMRDQMFRSGLPAARVAAYEGGFREQPAFEVWIVPEGAEPPKPTPTIDRKDIIFPPVKRATPSRKP
ncbi:MAG: hypothetical protein PSX80_12480 [bacterium]|nr:hypothetical protein [bacterium]